MHPLDNPVWSALSTAQRPISIGNDRARRFSPAVSPFAALADRASPDDWAALTAFVDNAETVGIFAIAPGMPPAPWEVVSRFGLIQMTCERASFVAAASIASRQGNKADAGATPSIRELTRDDGPEMLALAELTRPGPMTAQTVSLGRYIGIHDENGKLVAMAGERMRLDGFVEISGVCTHPDHQGRGYAPFLVTQATQHILNSGRTAFLHVKEDNPGAARVYRKLGFTVRTTFENGTFRKRL